MRHNAPATAAVIIAVLMVAVATAARQLLVPGDRVVLPAASDSGKVVAIIPVGVPADAQVCLQASNGQMHCRTVRQLRSEWVK